MRRHLRWLAAASPLLLALSSTSPVLGQKPGGILNISHFDSPASMSLHEEATVAAERPMMARLQQSRHVQPARAAEQPAIDRAGSGDQLGVERGRHRADLHAAPGRQMA